MTVLWRVELLAAATGFHAEGAEIFQGSRKATLAAGFLLLALAAGLRHPRDRETPGPAGRFRDVAKDGIASL